jgi:hypothetical protein
MNIRRIVQCFAAQGKILFGIEGPENEKDAEKSPMRINAILERSELSSSHKRILYTDLTKNTSPIDRK